MEQHITVVGLHGTNMDINKNDQEYLIKAKIKSLNGKIALIGTEEDFEEPIDEIMAKIQALTNLLEMI